MNHLITPAVLLLFATMLTGCEDEESSIETNQLRPSSDSQTTLRPDDEPSELNTGSSGINGGLSGRLITIYDHSIPYEFDLQTGLASPLPLLGGLEYFRSQPDTSQVQTGSFFAAGDGSPNQGFVETFYDCQVTVGEKSCISIYDSNFAVVRRFKVNDRKLQEPVKLSPSGRYLVMSETDEDFDNHILLMDVDSLTVTDSAFFTEGPGRSKLTRNPVVEWGANDEVIFSVPADDRPTIYVTSPRTLDVVRTITLPKAYKGLINGIDIHPDGKLLLLEYRSFDNFASSTAIILNLDTLTIGFPAIDGADINTQPLDDSFVSQFKNPTWSPDGQHIMLYNTYLTNSRAVLTAPGNDAIGQCMVAVPANARRTVVNGCFRGNPLPQGSDAILVRVQSPSTGVLSFSWPNVNTLNKEHFEWIE